MSVTAVASISALANHGDSSSESAATIAFHKTSQNLQSQQLDNAKHAANAIDTVKLSSQGQNQKLTSDVTTLSRHLESGDLGAAQTAYRAIQQDLRQHQSEERSKVQVPQNDASNTAISRNLDPLSLAVGSARVRASTATQARKAASDSNSNATTPSAGGNIDLSA